MYTLHMVSIKLYASSLINYDHLCIEVSIAYQLKLNMKIECFLRNSANGYGTIYSST